MPTPYPSRLAELTSPSQTIYIVSSALPMFDPTERRNTVLNPGMSMMYLKVNRFLFPLCI